MCDRLDHVRQYKRYAFFVQHCQNTAMIQWIRCSLNPLSPHDALKHHFTSLKTDLIFLQQSFLERKFPWNWFTNMWQFSLIFKPPQVIFIHYKSRIATAIRGLLWMKMTMGNSGSKGLMKKTLYNNLIRYTMNEVRLNILAVKLTRIAWFSAISPSILNRFYSNFAKAIFHSNPNSPENFIKII